jgi:hypothetical protein
MATADELYRLNLQKNSPAKQGGPGRQTPQ